MAASEPHVQIQQLAGPKQNKKTRLTVSHEHVLLAAPLYFSVLCIYLFLYKMWLKLVDRHKSYKRALLRFLKLQHCFFRMWSFLQKKIITAGRKLCKSCLIIVNTLKAGSQKWKRLFLILVWKAHKGEISKYHHLWKDNGQLTGAKPLFSEKFRRKWAVQFYKL